MLLPLGTRSSERIVEAQAEGIHADGAIDIDDTKRSIWPSDDLVAMVSTRLCVTYKRPTRTPTMVSRTTSLAHFWLMVDMKRVARRVPIDAGMRK
jgi:hypothetical protein